MVAAEAIKKLITFEGEAYKDEAAKYKFENGNRRVNYTTRYRQTGLLLVVRYISKNYELCCSQCLLHMVVL